MTSYAVDTTVYAPTSPLQNRSAIAASFSRDLLKIVAWCHVWGTRLSAKKAIALLISRSHTFFPSSSWLIRLGWSAVKYWISKTTKTRQIVGWHLRNTFNASRYRLHKNWVCFVNVLKHAWKSALLRLIFSCIFPHFEYCL